jgi:hypothetical protein
MDRAFSFSLWKQALEESQINDSKYANEAKALTSVLPWDHLDSGVRKEWLAEQWNLAEQGIETEDCRFGPCSLCGVCMDYDVRNLLQKGTRNENSFRVYERIFTSMDFALDMIKLFEKAIRRAALPVALSQGFNPRPKMSIALPLPVGVSSDGEYMELRIGGANGS